MTPSLTAGISCPIILRYEAFRVKYPFDEDTHNYLCQVSVVSRARPVGGEQVWISNYFLFQAPSRLLFYCSQHSSHSLFWDDGPSMVLAGLGLIPYSTHGTLCIRLMAPSKSAADRITFSLTFLISAFGWPPTMPMTMPQLQRGKMSTH